MNKYYEIGEPATVDIMHGTDHIMKIKSKTQDMYSHYNKDVSNLTKLTVYDIFRLYNINDGELQHAIKKMLALGERGDKSRNKDIEEAIRSLSLLYKG